MRMNSTLGSDHWTWSFEVAHPPTDTRMVSDNNEKSDVMSRTNLFHHLDQVSNHDGIHLLALLGGIN